MSQLKFEAESIQVSIYCEIILNILHKHKELSVNKMLFFAYVIKKERYILGNVYNGNNTQDIIYKCISFLSGDYVEFCNSIEYIIKSIHLLNTSEQIILKNNMLYSLYKVSGNKVLFEESKFIEKAIEESRRMNDKQFMKEVTNNV